MLFSKCLRAKIYCNMNVHFDPQGCQTLLLKESELYFLSLGSWTMVPIQPADTSNVEETSYFTAGFDLHRMFKSVARFGNAAI